MKPITREDWIMTAIGILVAAVVIALLLTSCSFRQSGNVYTLAGETWGGEVVLDSQNSPMTIYIEGENLPVEWHVSTGTTAKLNRRYILIEQVEKIP